MLLHRFCILVLLSVLIPNSSVYADLTEPSNFEKNRGKLLSFIIRKQLSRNHYSHKAINDELSKSAFELYLKQLDPQKRFLLQKDVKYLETFSLELDNQMNSGNLDFPIIAENLLQKKISLVEAMVEEIMAKGFSFEKKDRLETDPKKLTYCNTDEELRERWRKNLKYQVISRYINLVDDEKGKAKLAENASGEEGNEVIKKSSPKSDSELRKLASEKVIKSSRDLFKRIKRRNTQDKYDRYLSIITKAFDPHSDFMPPTQKEDFDIHMRGSLEGIGAVLQEEDGYIKIVRIIPGGAASRQRDIEAEDIILMVGEGPNEPVDIVDMRIREAVRLIRGKKGTEVWLTIKKPDSTIKTVKIIRDVVQLEETFVKSAVLPKNDSGEVYGYLRIPSFYRDFKNTRHGGNGRNVTDDVKSSLKELKGKNIKGLIVDLRNNGGGALIDAVQTAGLFIENGPIVQVKNSSERPDVLYDFDPDVHYKGPLVVLLNKFSASASEILAGALQDYNRAIIVGADHSYGKGTVQTLFNLDDNIPFMSFGMKKYTPMGALKMTTQKFYRINGESTQNRGVVPDVILPDRYKYVEAGEQYLENSMKWDKIEPVNFKKWKKGIDFKELIRESINRVRSDDDFIGIVKESEEAKKRQEDSIVTVTLSDIKADIEKIKNLTAGNTSSKEHENEGLTKNNDRDLSPEEKKEKFIEQLRDDPYVEESMYLLSDIAS